MTKSTAPTVLIANSSATLEDDISTVNAATSGAYEIEIGQ